MIWEGPPSNGFNREYKPNYSCTDPTPVLDIETLKCEANCKNEYCPKDFNSIEEREVCVEYDDNNKCIQCKQQ